MAESQDYDDLITSQKKEKKELIAKTQKMKHEIPKGDKKKKKEVTAEIAKMLSELEIRHENQIKEFENKAVGDSSSKEALEALNTSTSPDIPLNSPSILSNEGNCENAVTEEDDEISNKKSQRISKAQKRRNKKAEAAKERSKAIADQEIENLNSLRHLESEEIKKKLLEKNLTVHEIPPDGNCLYKAVEHQLSLNSKSMSAQSLRQLTADYLLQNKDDYLPFLTSPDTGDVLTEEQYIKYCEDMAKTSAWGGHIEIQVLSNICGMPIEVIQADGPSVIAGNDNADPKLIICYHRHVFGLGEHYNSTVPIENE